MQMLGNNYKTFKRIKNARTLKFDALLQISYYYFIANIESKQSTFKVSLRIVIFRV